MQYVPVNAPLRGLYVKLLHGGEAEKCDSAIIYVEYERIVVASLEKSQGHSWLLKKKRSKT